MPEPHDELLLIGHGSLDEDGMAENRQFAVLLAEHLGVRVTPCFLELAEPPLIDGIVACVERAPRRVLILPLFLGAGGHQKNDVPALINWAKRQWPNIEFRYGAPLGAQYALVSTLAARAEEARAAATGAFALAETALLVVGRGSRDPDSNSEVHKIARLLWEGRGYGWVETAFYSLTGPNVETGIERCIRLGAKRVVVLPYLLFNGRICRALGEQATRAQRRFPDTKIVVAEHMGLHEGVLAAVVQRYEELRDGSAAMTCDVCKYRQRFVGFEDEYGIPQSTDHDHGMRGVAHGRGAPITLDVLPLRYKGGKQVSAAPMAAAALVFDAEGRVAWNAMWGGDDPGNPFCELALAGGPPHRGALLEPVSPADVAADPQGYARVLDELARGIQMVTGLPVLADRAPGWVGVVCDSAEMALWLLRAIVVENISVRREEQVLFLPAGPAFRLEHEIKNVITALAKTYHYWQEHMAVTR